jgi:hypothetical protein
MYCQERNAIQPERSQMGDKKTWDPSVEGSHQVDEKAAVLKGHGFIRAANPAISGRL